MSSRNKLQPQYVTMKKLRHALPQGMKIKGTYAFRHCDVCDQDEMDCNCMARMLALDENLYYLCRDCWARWKRENQHVLVMLEIMK